MGEPFNFSLDDKSIEVSIVRCHPALTLLSNRLFKNIKSIIQVSDNSFTLVINGQQKTVWWAQDENAIYVRFDGRTHTLFYKDAISASRQVGANEDTIKADMPGIVVKINCDAGDKVKTGDILIVIESMKMQINVVAPRDGVVEEVHTATNATFEKDFALISLEVEQ